MTRVWKIIARDELASARQRGLIAPAPIDVADGYVHLSGDDQVLETARLHFAGRDDLVAVAFDGTDFGARLKWEASRGGAFFPHLYADLPISLAREARALERRPDGAYQFGDRL